MQEYGRLSNKDPLYIIVWADASLEYSESLANQNAEFTA